MRKSLVFFRSRLGYGCFYRLFRDGIILLEKEKERAKKCCCFEPFKLEIKSGCVGSSVTVAVVRSIEQQPR